MVPAVEADNQVVCFLIGVLGPIVHFVGIRSARFVLFNRQLQPLGESGTELEHLFGLSVRYTFAFFEPE